MDMKTSLFALAWMPVLGLLTAVTLAGEANLPEDSFNGAIAADGNIKNRNQCPSGSTFFKNEFPSLTNGTTDGSTTIDFTVEGKIVPMTITWAANNSFGFELDGGVAYIVGVTVDTNNFIYDYKDMLPNGRADTELNYYDGEAAADVNHLDLCLATLDDEDPVVTITKPADGDTVSGTVSIMATVTDNAGPLESVTASVDGVPPLDGQSIPVAGPDMVDNVYTWSFDASMLELGEYTITVSATDTSILANTTTVSITVTVVRSLQDCLEGLDEIPPGAESEGGCNLTGNMQLEYPNAAGQAGNLPVTQATIPAKSGAQTATCGNSGEFPLIAHDPRVDADGDLKLNPVSQDLSYLFDIQGHYNEFHGGAPAPLVFLRADTVGSPCLALLHQDAPEFSELTAGLLNGGVYTVTQFPENVPGMYAGKARITAPLSVQPDLQFVEQAALQTDEPTRLVEGEASPFTSDVFNPSRTKGFKGTFFPLNTREVCLFLDPMLSKADGAPYFEAVLQCKTDLAVEYFNNLEQALIEAEPNLIAPSLNTLMTDLNKSRSMVKVGRWKKATIDLGALSDGVTDATWNVTPDNSPGNLIMRIDNLFFRIDQLELAESML
jgi:hypothetical protein